MRHSLSALSRGKALPLLVLLSGLLLIYSGKETGESKAPNVVNDSKLSAASFVRRVDYDGGLKREGPLSEWEPMNYHLVRMILRGLEDFYFLEERVPFSLEELIKKGYLPYLPSERMLGQMSFEWGGEKVVVGYLEQLTDPAEVFEGRLVLPPDGFSEDEKSKMTRGGMKKVERLSETEPGLARAKFAGKFYFLVGEILRDGGDVSEQELPTYLRYQRLAALLSFTARDFKRVKGRYPRNIAELEEFIGLKRNPHAWFDLRPVDDPKELFELRPGEVVFYYTQSGQQVIRIGGPAGGIEVLVPGKRLLF